MKGKFTLKSRTVTGKVLNIDDDKVHVVTDDREFAVLKKRRTIPEVDDYYTGKVYNPVRETIPGILFMLIIGLVAFSIYNLLTANPAADLHVTMGARYKVTVSSSQEVLDITPLNNTSTAIIRANPVKSKDLNEALEELFELTLDQDFGANFIDGNDYVSIYVDNIVDDFSLNVIPFSFYLKNLDVSLIVNDNGEIKTP